MKIYLSCGLGMTLANAAFTLLLFFLGYHSDVEKIDSTAIGIIGFLVLLGVTIAGLIFAMRAIRESAPDGSLSYGRGVGAGAMTSVFFGLFSAAFQYLYSSVINPDYGDLLVQAKIAAYEQAGIAGAQLDQMEAGMRWFMLRPGLTSAFMFIIIVGLTTIVALFVAIGMKRAAPPPAVVPPAMPV